MVSVDSSATVTLVEVVAVAALPFKFDVIVPGNLALSIVPLEILEAFNEVNPEPPPLNSVADKVPSEELNVRLVPLFGGRSPVAAVTNSGKQVVSADSSATVTLVEVVAVAALTLVKLEPSPWNSVAVMTPVILIWPVPVISLLLRSRSPPSCGVISSITSLRALTWDAEIFVKLEPSP